MSVALEVTGFLLGVASWLVTGISLANDYWKVSSVVGSVIISNRDYENLWHSCSEAGTGIRECRDFESLLSLTGFQQACRALMIIALILGLAAIIMSILGMKCIRIGSSNEQTKAKIAVTAGILFILSSLCTLTPVSWYAARVIQDFYKVVPDIKRFEMGAGLYLGWAGAALSLLGGALLCCACKEATTNKSKGTYYAANQGQKIHKPVSDVETAKAFV